MQPKNNGLPCDDGQPCTKGDFCQGGGCASGADICACKADLDCLGKDDGNLCNGLPYCDKSAVPWVCDTNPATVVTCKTLDDTTCRKAVCTAKSGICELLPINQGIACDDSSACTGGEVCKDGGCKGASVDCDDDVPCTIDACDKATGCSHLTNLALCDDGKPCTSDGCDPKALGADALGCTHKALTGTPCDDGSLCSETDACLVGACQGKAKVCDDANPCSDDGCDPKSGCTHAANAAPCKTDKPCQPLGACNALSCNPLPGAMWSALCDDKATEVPAAIAAAADGSTFVVGRSAPPGGKAEDGQLWLARVAAGGASTVFHKTLGGAGDDAGFAVAALVAPTLSPGAAAGPSDVLALIAGRRAAGSKGGADGYVARVAADGAPLWQQHIGGAGDDELRGLCALPDGQSAVAGRLGSGDGAVALLARLDAQGTVLWSTALQLAGSKAGIAWAVDRHVGSKGTEAWLVGGGRKDGAGVDGAFAAKVDGDGNVLWQVGLGVGKSGDTTGVARALRSTPSGGALLAGGEGAAGRLIHLHADGKVVFDLGFGAAGGGKLSGLSALHDGAALAVGTTKDDAGKAVVWLLRVDLEGTLLWQRTLPGAVATTLPGLATFDDGRIAVVTAIDKAAEAAAVDAGARVTVLDAFGFESCEVQGICKGKQRPDCDDANPCTHDGCAAELGCSHQVHGLPCEDGDACSLGEACKAGKCVGSKGACDDGNPCTKDACDPKTGCNHQKSDGPCDDGEPCSTGEICAAGVCQPGKLLDCDDGNLCTTDSCEKGKGCQLVANDVVCDTGSCTVGDKCQAGLCKTSTLSRYVTTWHGQTGADSARKVRAMSDNGFLISGLTWTKPDHDGLLVRTNAAGSALWQVALEGPKGCCGQHSNQAGSNDRFEDAIETPFGLLAVGRTSICTDQGWAVFLDLQGKVLWNHAIAYDNTCGSGYNRSIFYAAAPGNDGTWAMAGHNYYHPFTPSTYRGLLVRMTQSGTVASQKAIGTFRQIFDLQARPGGGYFAAGEILDGGLANQGRLALLDADGDALWAVNVHVGNNGDADFLTRVAAMPDGGALGIGYGGGTGARQILALRVNANGSVRYSKVLGTGGDDIGSGVVGRPDGSAVVLATTWGKGPGNGDAWLIGLDGAGNVTWEKVHGSPDADLPSHLETRTDGGLAMLTTADGPGGSDTDVQLRTLDAWGYGDCKAAGTCSAMPALACDDANVCTVDVCDGAKGCTHAALPDGTACANGVGCKAGACKP